MLWIFSAAGLTGMICGSLSRAPALIFLSFIVFGGGFIWFISGPSAGRAFLMAFLLTATLQLGYLIGAGLCYLWRRLRLQADTFQPSPDMQSTVRQSRQGSFYENWAKSEEQI